MRRETDDYWTESDVQKFAKNSEIFSFDNEEERPGNLFSNTSSSKVHSTLKEVIGTGGTTSVSVSDVKKKHIPDLSELMSDKSLNIVLEADQVFDPLVQTKGKIPIEEEVKLIRRQIQNRWDPIEEKSTVQRMVLGQPYSLELYRTLDRKRNLLNCAIDVGDGSAILAVTLFLMRTLKKSLFNNILANNPIAANHYIHYLSTRMQINDLTDTLTMLGRNKDASMKQFEITCQISNTQRQLKRLTSCVQNHFTGDKDRFHVERFIKLLEWQQTTGAPEVQSVADCLHYLCKNHWSKAKNDPHSPFLISQQYGVNEKLFQWTALVVHAQMKAWGDIDNIFMTKQWLGGSKLKTALPIEYVVKKLYKLEAPKETLVSYIRLIDNMDHRLSIAKSIRCDRGILDTYTAMRDRLGLISYLANLDPKSEDYKYAEQLLSSTPTKWKN
ncbi:spermatogenesis-defective protein 39 homolog [Nilaparvata lugens]|uniref:spermatogenesis-defective protein 39 homolog n=1 Tax=Nilaparvata lugens TaxID=108931 RepID=UPI00193E3A6C|nr:spermatogenesis-defective protein 39 homolog [Nilaparvata lugens]XP_039288522.1 spermatogenesis-defective protein 39 homolog [Nilaparvata lugens]XP_039288524.1 spermatogenesis-defective protein 39 homolog [Nilaparvata lugens]